MTKTNKPASLSTDSEYKSWLKDLKLKVQQTQIKAAIQVNSTLLAFYWELGADIVQRQASANWGDGFLKQLSKDLMAEFPEIKGFSLSNIKYIRQWYLFYSPEAEKSQQLVGQLIRIPWGHNLKIISKCQSVAEALYYVQNTNEQGWSRNVLTHQIESGLWQRDFYIDLLFYHARLHCYVVIELKAGDFEPEHAGKLNFYIKAVDEQLRKEGDAPTIGILLCKNKDKLVAEYALSDIQKPIGVSEYQLTQSLPENLQSQLPSVEEIEQELGGDL